MPEHGKVLPHAAGALRVGLTKRHTRIRRGVRKTSHAIYGVLGRRTKLHKRLHVYTNVDEFAAALFPSKGRPLVKDAALQRVFTMAKQLGYTVVESDENKPWGGMYRMADTDVAQFIEEFFPGLTLEEARLGRTDVRLSPKFLLLEPGKRLSWQYHNRRAERWHFLTAGTYWLSDDDIQPQPIEAPAGTIVQLATRARHRVLSSNATRYTLVAEIWQHTDQSCLSDEDDIVRLADDYRRTIHRR